MEPSLTVAPLTPPSGRIALARVHQAIGWAGTAGILLFLLAVAIFLKTLTRDGELRQINERGRFSVAPAASPPAVPALPKAVRLPGRDDVGVLMARVERAAVANGLRWSAADYRIVPASEARGATLEIQCGFKAPYPQLRGLIADVLGAASAVTFRELSFARTAVDVPEVDAKLLIVMFLDEDRGLTTDQPGRR